MIRRQERHEYRKIGNERWLVSYADIVTLLFAVFVVLYSVSYVNETKYKELSQTLSDAFQGEIEAMVSDEMLFDANIFDTTTYTSMLENTLKGIDEDISFEAKNVGNTLEVSVNANALFASGSALPSGEAQTLFLAIADQLENFKGHIAVAGHTDNQPINTAAFSNNWELSSARAIAIVQLLKQGGIAPKAMSAEAFGEFKPIASNATQNGRAQNRRVVLTLSPTTDEDATVQTIEDPVEVLPVEQNILLLEPDDDKSVVDPVQMNNGGLLFTDDPSRAERFDDLK